MVNFYQFDDRRCRLFALGCVRLVWHLVPAWGREWVAAAEEYAERGIYTAIREEGLPVSDISNAGRFVILCATYSDPRDAARSTPDAVWDLWRLREPELPHVRMAERIDSLIGCVLGTGPIVWRDEWRSPDVIGLAESIHAKHGWDRMPVLGDALEDAGCDNELVLQHCRGGGSHARGCWVVEWAMGRRYHWIGSADGSVAVRPAS